MGKHSEYNEENVSCEQENDSEIEEVPSEEEYIEVSDEQNLDEESSEGEEPCEELIEEDPDEELIEDDPDEELIEEDPDQEPYKKELCEEQGEELYESEPEEEEEIDDERIEVHGEYVQEGFEPQTSLKHNDEKHKLSSGPSCLDKKRRSAGKSQGYEENRQKHNEDSHTYSTSMEEKENTQRFGNKRRSKWDKDPETYRVECSTNPDTTTKKRRTRWSTEDSQSKLLDPSNLPDFVKNIVGGTSADPVLEKLNSELIQINQKLNDIVSVDNQASLNDPIKAKLEKKLIKRRQEIMLRLIQGNAAFYFRPKKLFRKLYIPVEEYPDYNFVGLILGPRGNTQKKMEMETGAKILLRGKGSTMKNKHTVKNLEDDDLHVYIEAETPESLNAAAKMVEKLLVPMEETMNEHKKFQLRELAALNGTLRQDEYSCKTQNPCDICGNTMHPTTSCPLTASNPGVIKSNDFLAYVGSFGASPFIHPQVPSYSPTLVGNQQSEALASSNIKCLNEMNVTNLYVAHLPHFVNDEKLKELFSPFGCISKAVVIKEKTTGLSKGYGFVHYTDPACSAAAVTHMNGYSIAGKILLVKVADHLLSNTNTNIITQQSNFGNLPSHPTATIAQGVPDVMSWPGPPGSILPETHVTFPSKNSLAADSSSYPAFVSQGEQCAMSWPGPPGSMLPEAYASFPPKNSFAVDSSSYPTSSISQGEQGAISWPGPPGSMLSQAPESFPLKKSFMTADFSIYPTSAISQGEHGAMNWTGSPGSMFPKAHASFPPKSNFTSTADLLSNRTSTSAIYQLDPPGGRNWPGPPGSLLPEAHASFPPKQNFTSHTNWPSYPTAGSQGESSVVNWPGPPGSMLP
ncbi:splicing factor-like protein 1 isoform X1 [Zingiber officinale]|uniref:RRM domain-containing protein n=1 Tax=Zingiber officinale TaxID=94328 RepID=A0A8J5CWL3_ZINOF|nr:splicing factor-like protein 1 isoform X1 [Zingiber officinale]XP_042443620.1 splicing factor-like protein 1 isoform X1 [Zingiber officinale]KAG6472796.1 hypothetical protein ZIOFF_070274 [Zingiber officinale]